MEEGGGREGGKEGGMEGRKKPRNFFKDPFGFSCLENAGWPLGYKILQVGEPVPIGKKIKAFGNFGLFFLSLSI